VARAERRRKNDSHSSNRRLGCLRLREGSTPEGDYRRTVALSALEQSLYPQLTVREHSFLPRKCEVARREPMSFRTTWGLDTPRTSSPGPCRPA